MTTPCRIPCRSASRRSSPAAAPLSASLLFAFLAASCAPEQTVVNYHPFLANLPDAKTAAGPVGSRFDNFRDPTAASPDEKAVVENPDGTKTLRSSNVRQLMSQIVTSIQNDDLEDFYDQLVAERTKEEYRSRGQDPFAFVQFLREHEADIIEMFNRMPMAEHTPAVALTQPQRNTFRLVLTGLARNNVKFTEIWAVHDKGVFKLLWIK